MKTVGWTVLVVVFIIMAMIILTIASQTDLLQSRAKQGIGSPAEHELLVP